MQSFEQGEQRRRTLQPVYTYKKSLQKSMMATNNNIATHEEEVLFNSDTLSRIISYLPSTDLLNLALTCKRFGISDDDELSVIKKSTHIVVQDIATEEQLAALPHYDGDTSLADYHYLQLMRKPLIFDQLIAGAEYVNTGDKSRVRKSTVNSPYNPPLQAAVGDYATAFSNIVMRAGKHYVSFKIENGAAICGAGVMRPGKANQHARGLPYYKYFYNNFSPSISRGECNSNNSSVQCCVYDTFNGKCCFSDLRKYSQTSTTKPWDGMESMFSDGEIGMLLDLDEGTLTVYKNGRKLGIMKRGLAGPYCWVASMWNGTSVTIKRGIPPS